MKKQGESPCKDNGGGVKPLKYHRKLWYSVIGLLVQATRLIFGARTDKAARKAYLKDRTPKLILVNHASPIDFIFVCQAMWPRHGSFVVAENMYYHKLFAWFLQRGGVITKKQFLPDFSCVRNIKNQIEAGVDVILFPEGKVANDGVAVAPPKSTVKLIKWLGCPVAAIKIKGAGISDPKWAAKRNRRGRIETEIKDIMTAEEVKSLSSDEVYERVVNAIKHNDHEWQQENGLKFYSSKFAVGLEKIFYKCPTCGEYYTFTSKKNIVKCGNCGLEVKYMHDGRLLPLNASNAAKAVDTAFIKSEDAAPAPDLINSEDAFSVPDRIDRWAAWQRECVRREVEASTEFSLTENVKIMTADSQAKKIRFAGDGTLRLDYKALTYEGTVDGEKKTLMFATDFLYTVACQPGLGIDMYDDKNIYHFRFDESRAPARFVTALEEIYKVKTAKGV
ncbi:MAG: 1-acyl-sn-glycerol-3-phosphate acyltransferase [Clostridiaceae bacterium]|nr:1-acyl-sn-glycerol-3-phosphate acyltransferase [Clostridiaceae bacterium]